MQSELYGQAEALTDYPFNSLEYLDGLPKDTPSETVTLSFSVEIHALFSRVCFLLRRPMAELAGALLTSGAITLPSYIGEALKGKGLDEDPHVPEWAVRATEFESLAHRGLLPINHHGFNPWDVFCIEKPKPRRRATANQMEVAA